jgi:NAD(P)-dependent dehydrogenase (short-subunit alcohol dehydrogenase family)
MDKSTKDYHFGFSTTAMDVVERFCSEAGVQKRGVAVVTGGNSGIGVETVRALSFSGCSTVVLCSRNVQAGEQVAESINKELKEKNVSSVVVVQTLDLSDLQSVRECAASLLSSYAEIQYLVLNAGVMACPLTRTKQGFEQQIGVNHLGHFYLTHALLPALKAAGRKGNESRIISVSSLAHKMGSLNLDDLNYEKRNYWSWKAYGDSKLANVLFGKYLAQNLENDNILVYCVHPGSIVTNLQQYSLLSRIIQKLFFILPGQTFISTKTIPQGAATTVFAILAPDIPSGSYLSDCQIAESTAASKDMDMAAKLWSTSTQLITNAGFDM